MVIAVAGNGHASSSASMESIANQVRNPGWLIAEWQRGVDHWPLRARTEGLDSLKQLSEVRLAHPLMLRQALNLVQHPCVHPNISAPGSDMLNALHAELQDWKSLPQTRTLWLPALQGDLAGLID